MVDGHFYDWKDVTSDIPEASALSHFSLRIYSRNCGLKIDSNKMKMRFEDGVF